MEQVMTLAQAVNCARSSLSQNDFKNADMYARNILRGSSDPVVFDILDSSLLTEIAKYQEMSLMMMSPIDRFIALHFLHDNTGHFSPDYIKWRLTRVRKTMEIYGIDFKGKRILELGAGIGEIGSVFAQLGADVVGLEGRASNCSLAKLRFRDLENYHIIQWDLEKDFSNFGTFDLIINFGLVEVIENFKPLLSCCMQMSNTIFLETMVCDSTDPNLIAYVEMPTSENICDWPMSGKSPRPSPFYIERLFSDQNFEINRYFHADLNAPPHVYDWPHENDNKTHGGLRRFWCFTKRT